MAYLYTMINSHLTGQQSRARGRSYDAKAKCRALLGAGCLGAIVLAGALCAAGALMPQPARAQATASAAVMASDPTAMVKGVIDQATAVVRDTQTPTPERDRRLRAIAEANFDFADMARTTLGYHWRQITPQQRAQFVPLFTSFMENVYLSKLQEYSVQKVRQDVNASNISFIGQQSKVLNTTWIRRNFRSTATSAKFPMVTGISAPPGLPRSLATIAPDASMPRTSTPRSRW